MKSCLENKIAKFRDILVDFETAFCRRLIDITGEDYIKKARDEYAALTQKYEIFAEEKQIQLSKTESTHDPRPAAGPAACSAPSTANQVTVITACIASAKLEIKQDTVDIQTRLLNQISPLSRRLSSRLPSRMLKRTLKTSCLDCTERKLPCCLTKPKPLWKSLPRKEPVFSAN